MRVPALAVLLSLAALGAGEEYDMIFLKNGAKRECVVATETRDAIVWRGKASGSKETELKWKDAARLPEYGEMRSGPWPTALDARDRGKYEEAADLFNEVANGGREWQKVYGAYHEGEALELAGKFTAAAEAFARVDSFPKHRLWLDAKYHQGFCLALSKKDAEATKIADELSAYAKANNLAPAEIRATAIRGALAAAKGDASKLAAVRFSQVAEPDAWFHWAVFHADTLRRTNRMSDAVREYRNLASQLDDDPAKKALASFGLGVCLIESDKQSALVELLKLDALPYGSPAQKCEARFHAGKLLWEEAKAAQAEGGDAKRIEFHKANAKTARMLLKAAANSESDSTAKADAKKLLDEIGPDPEEKAKADKAAADKAAADKAAPKKDATVEEE